MIVPKRKLTTIAQYNGDVDVAATVHWGQLGPHLGSQ